MSDLEWKFIPTSVHIPKKNIMEYSLWVSDIVSCVLSYDPERDLYYCHGYCGNGSIFTILNGENKPNDLEHAKSIAIDLLKSAICSSIDDSNEVIQEEQECIDQMNDAFETLQKLLNKEIGNAN